MRLPIQAKAVFSNSQSHISLNRFRPSIHPSGGVADLDKWYCVTCSNGNGEPNGIRRSQLAITELVAIAAVCGGLGSARRGRCED